MHDRVFGFCDNKCKKEVVSLRDFEEKMNDGEMLHFKTALGRSIVAQGTYKAPILKMRTLGKSEQVKTTGAQLIESNLETGEIFGMTITRNNDGSYTLDGTATDVATFRIDQRTIHGTNNLKTYDGTYTISLEGNTNENVCVWIMQDVTFAQPLTASTKAVTDTFTFDNCFVCIAVNSGVTLSNFVVKPMLNAGSTALPYEPYTGGIAAPNPQYPQEIVSAGDTGVVKTEVLSGNLFDVSGYTGTATTVDKDGWCSATIDNTSGTSAKVTGFNIPKLDLLKPNTDYAVVCEIATISNADILITNNSESSNKGQFGKNTSANTTGTHVKVVTTRESFDDCITMLRTYISVGAGKSGSVKFRISVLADTTVTADSFVYQPYTKQTLTFSTPNGLPGVPTTDASIANYTDADGQMWVCDTREWERGVDVKRIEKEQLTSALNWVLHSSGVGYYTMLPATMLNNYLPPERNTKPSALCTIATPDIWTTALTKEGLFCISYDGYLAFGYSGTLAEFKAMLDAKKPTLYYTLATPIETPIPEEELAAWRALHANEGATTILSDADTEIEYPTSRAGEVAAEAHRQAEINKTEIQEVNELLPKVLTKDDFTDSGDTLILNWL